MGAVFSKMSEFFVTASGQRAEGEEGLFPRTNYIQQARIRNLERWMWSHVDEMLMAQVKHMVRVCICMYLRVDCMCVYLYVACVSH
jgi:hypothetical protein